MVQLVVTMYLFLFSVKSYGPATQSSFLQNMGIALRLKV